MAFTLILGPMKSGKSFELISQFAPMQYTNMKYMLYHPKLNVRDDQVRSRTGVELSSKKVDTLSEALNGYWDLIGVDEFHMFNEDDVVVIDQLIRKGTDVVISTLDLDYRGILFDVVKKLLQLAPDKVIYKKAVCENCKSYSAVYSQVLKDGKAVTGELPSVLPEDGQLEYRAVCRRCFLKK